MRLLERSSDGELSVTKNLSDDHLPEYAILSHTWGTDSEEVTFEDLMNGTGKTKVGYDKIRFCGDQASRDGLQHFWVDTCCIKKSSDAELTEAINSMFHWYQRAAKCYVFLSDVLFLKDVKDDFWLSAFRGSRWFTRGWTLQELIAPASVEFFSVGGMRLGDKKSLEQEIYEMTGIPVQALQRSLLSGFSVAERMSWAAKRKTTRKEDGAYCLLGIFNIHMPLIYGEGDKAILRLQEEIDKTSLQNHQKHVRFTRVIEWLGSADVTTHHSIISQIPSPGTNQWFINSDEFLSWEKSKSGIFWVNAKPGAGKTVLMCSAINHLKSVQYQAKEALAYFYCDNRDNSRRDPKAILGSLLGQFCFQNPEIFKIISASFDQHNQDTFEHFATLEVLQDLFISTQTQYDRLTIVLDALDECRNRGPFLTWLCNIGTSDSGNVRLLLTSRREQDIESVLGNVAQIRLDTSSMSEDIGLMLVTETSRRRRDNASFLAQPDFREKILQGILEGADGNFQWARCQFDSLCVLRDDEERAKLVGTLEVSLDISYERVLSSICQLPKWKSELAIWLVEWLCCSLRPMKFRELMAALELSKPELYRPMKDLASPPEIFQMFSGLVKWEEEHGIISFSHFSIKELILSRRLEGTLAEVFHVNKDLAHGVLAKLCLKYLLKLDPRSYDTEKRLEKDLLKYPLMDYAAKSWIEHTQNAGPDTDLDSLIIKLLTEHQKEADNPSYYSHFGMWEQAEKHKKHWFSSFSKVHSETPITVAITTKRWTVIKELIDDGFHFRNKTYRMPLNWAISQGLDDVLELLLDNGANPNETSSEGETTALHAAVSTDNIPAARILIKQGGDPHLVCGDVEGSPFSSAVEYSSLDMIEFLIQNLRPGTIDSYGGHCGTALQKAASTGRKDALCLLIQHNADVNLNLSNYGSALHQAATSGHMSIVRCLITQGADPNTQGERGSPLQAAIFFGKNLIANFLLKYSRTDPNLDTGLHGNALQQALLSNDVNISRVLIRRGATGFSEHGFCKTALEAAIQHSDKGLLTELINRFPDHLTVGPHPSRILQRAILSDKVHALAFLIQRGTRADTPDEYGWTPWLCAQHCHHVKGLQILGQYRSPMPPLGLTLPKFWDIKFLPDCIKLSSDGLTVEYEPEKEESNLSGDQYQIYADAPCPPCSSFYFEITVLLMWTKFSLSIGLCRGQGILEVKQEPYSYNDYGSIYPGRISMDSPKGPEWSTQDTVGCGYDWEKEQIFFTHNGVLVANSITRAGRGKFFPTVHFQKQSSLITANFGTSPFLYISN